MSEQGFPLTRPDVVVVQENMRTVHVMWGIVVGITVVGLLALNLLVEITPENRTATTVLTIVAPAAFISWWVWSVLHPARIEFSHDAIAFRRRSSRRVMTIERTDGEVELASEATVVGTHASVTLVLRPTHGGGPSLPISTFNPPDIRRGCEATDWTVAGSVPGEPKKSR